MATVHWRWCFAIFNLSPDIIKHKTGFLVEIPVQSGREIEFFSAPDSLTVQVYIREPRCQLPGPPSSLKRTEVMFWVQAEKSTAFSAIISMFARNEVTSKQIKSPEIRVAQCIRILEDMKILPLEGEGTIDNCKFCVDKIRRVRNKFACIHKSIIRKPRLRTRPELLPDILNTTKLMAVGKAQVEKLFPGLLIKWEGGVGRAMFSELAERKAFMEDYFALVLEGYTLENTLPDAWLERIPLFLRVVQMQELLYYLQYIDDPDEEIQAGLRYKIRCIEDDLPYLGFFDPVYSPTRPFCL